MPASIFAGSKVKTLKSTLSLNGGADIISSTTNPQSSAVSAEPGSLLLNTTSGIMYRKLDAGSTTNWVEVGSGAGTKNYIKNPDFDGGLTTGWSMQKVSLSSLIPTGNIGAADAGHTIAASSSSPLEGANSLLVQGASLFTAGNCLVSEAFAIDRQDQSKVMGWSFYFEAITSNMDFSGTSAGTWAVYIAEVTTATPDTVVSWIQPAGVYNLIQSSGAGISSGTFQTTAAGTAYRLVLVCINSEAAATTLKVDDFQLGPQKVLQGPSGPVGEIIATGSITPPQGFLYCNGQSVSVSQYQDLFNSIGYTYGGAGASFNVPDLRGVFLRGAGSQTIGAETYTATLGTKQNDATAKNGLFDSGHVHTQQAPNLATGGAINVRQFVSGTGSVPTSENITTASGAANLSSTDTETRPANVAVAYHIRYLATYQMSQDTDTRVVAARATSAITGVVAGDATVIYPTSVNDTHGSYSAATGIYTVPVSGFYRATASIFFDVYSWTAGDLVDLRINCAGTIVSRNYHRMPTLTTKQISADTCSTFYATAGQQITVSASQNVGGTRNLDGNSSLNYFTVERLSGPATIAASETVAASYGTSAAPSIPNNSATIVVYPTRQFDTHSMMNTSTGVVTIPVSGKYLINAGHYFGSSIGATATDVQTICRKNGSTIQATNIPKSGTSAGPLATQGTFLVQCLAGDTIGIYLLQANSAASAQSLLASAEFNYMTITRVGN